jgi:hypothetical protein
MSDADDEVPDVFTARGPDGQPLDAGRRMTYRAARGWSKRRDVLLGRWPCGHPIVWLDGEASRSLAAELRKAEGKDCNLAGDVLLFRLADGRPAVVVDEQ